VSFKAKAAGKDKAMVHKWAQIQCYDFFTTADSMCNERILNCDNSRSGVVVKEKTQIWCEVK
jgi:hypothetical protein